MLVPDENLFGPGSDYNPEDVYNAFRNDDAFAMSPPRQSQESAQSSPGSRALRTNNTDASQESAPSENPIKRRRVRNAGFVLDEADDDDDDEDENEDEKSVRNSLNAPNNPSFDTQLHVSSWQDANSFIVPDDENHSQGDEQLEAETYLRQNKCMMITGIDENGEDEICGDPCGHHQVCHFCLQYNFRGAII